MIYARFDSETRKLSVFDHEYRVLAMDVVSYAETPEHALSRLAFHLRPAHELRSGIVVPAAEFDPTDHTTLVEVVAGRPGDWADEPAAADAACIEGAAEDAARDDVAANHGWQTIPVPDEVYSALYAALDAKGLMGYGLPAALESVLTARGFLA